MTGSPNSRLRILLVDDDSAFAVLADNAFAHTSVHPIVHRAENGETAISELRSSNATTDRRIGLVLLDLRLPCMTGHETLATIKQDPALRRVPVVVVTTSTQEEDVTRAYDNGANAYVVKPRTFEQLKAMLEAICKFWGQTVLPHVDERSAT
jgi:two-component system response regulator